MHIPTSSLYRGAKNVMTLQEPRVSIPKAIETAVRKTKITRTQDTVSLSRPTINVVMRESTAIPRATIEKALKEFQENTASYDTLRGRINAQADQAGMRINILFSERHPGKLEVEIADKSIPQSREFVDEFAGIFTDPKNMGRHFKTLKTMLKGAANGDKQGDITRVVIDPKENYAQKIGDALLDAIEARELARIK